MKPLLFHVHVPKCAGTSLRRYFDRSFGKQHVSLYVDRTSYLYTPGILAETVVGNHDVTAVSTHFFRVFPPLIGARPVLYVTYLRDPVRHFLSYLTYIKKVYAGIREPELLRYVPKDTPEMTIREMAEWVLTRDAAIPFKENYQTNFFAEHAWYDISGTSRMRSPCGDDRWDPAQFAAYCAVRQDLARLVLAKFFFVGVVESMQDGIQALRAKCSALGMELADAQVGTENTSHELLDDTGWIHPGDRTGRLLLESLREDFRLYCWAKARFEAAAPRDCAALKWDRRLVTSSQQDGGPVYLVVHGMKRLIDPGSIARLEHIPRQVQRIPEHELQELPPGAPVSSAEML